jgi:hypothetical protein
MMTPRPEKIPNALPLRVLGLPPHGRVRLRVEVG